MRAWKLGLALLVLLMGGLQAWDSDVFSAGNLIIALVVLALLVVAAAITTTAGPRLLAAAGVVSLLLLAIARLTSPIPLPALLAIGPFIFMALVVSWHIEEKQRGAGV